MASNAKIYCALDLEGTGLDPKKDAITEAGAVSFTLSKNGELEFLKEFSQLVKPPIPIPEFIQDLTNIRTKDVENAPVWEEVKDSFEKFVGDHIIVGQNIQFDLSFLAAQGLEFKQGFIDTRELASIFVPEARFYNLEYLMRFFSAPLKSHHRALEDSKSAAQLLQRLVQHFRARPLAVQKQVAKLLAGSGLVYHPLFSADAAAGRRRKTLGAPANATKAPALAGKQPELFAAPKTGSTGSIPVSGLDWDRILDASGTAFVDLGLSEFSPAGLKNLAQAVLGRPGETVLCVGTEEEFSQIQSCGGDEDRTVVDDPQNYLCEQSLRELLGQKRLSDPLIQFLIKLLIWKSINPDEHLNKLQLSGSDHIFIDLVAGDFANCSSHPKGRDCELARVLYRLPAARRVFTKHSAWSKLVGAGQAQRPREYGLFWNMEALEQTLLAKAGTSLSLKDLRGSLSALYDPEDGSGVIGKLDAAAKRNFEQTLNALDLTFGLWSIILTQDLLVTSQRACDAGLRDTDAFGKMRRAAEELISRMSALLGSLPASTAADLPAGRILVSLKADLSFLTEFFEEPAPSRVYWFDIFAGRLKLKSQTLTSSLLPLGDFRSKTLWGIVSGERVKHYYRRIFGIAESETFPLIASRPALRLLVARDLPEKETPNSQKQTIRVLQELLPECAGRSLVLFNSQKSLEHVYQNLPRHGLDNRLLIQKYTGHHWKNLESFQALPDAIWFLTINNFLKNTQTLPPVENLLLMRLPYEVPGALAGAFEPDEIFESYVLPKTALRLMGILQRFVGGAAGAVTPRQQDETLSPRKLIVLDPRLILDYNLPLLSVFRSLCEVSEQDFSQRDAKTLLH